MKAFAVGGCAAVLMSLQASAGAAMWFDDFGQPDLDALRSSGWQVRSAAGHPGVPGARWAVDGVSLVGDPAKPGNRLLRLSAQTDGTPEGTRQAQVCHQRRALNGTYAARVRFTDAPISGIDGDPVIQTFYAVSPLRFDYDPSFSELDWEYLPNGGWGSEATRLYAIAWQTVRIEPWDAHNALQEVKRSMDGWHTLLMQVDGGRNRWFVDGVPVADHGGRHHPVVPMAISFSLWFSPTGLLPRSDVPRVWQTEVDWVLFAPEVSLSPGQVDEQVEALRRQGVAHVDTVKTPVIDSRCDF